MASKLINFYLNGRQTEVLVKPLTTVQTLLREQLDLTATKSGCRQGGCGSCTILVDGEPMLSCLLPVEDIQSRQIITLEGLTSAESLDTIQETFHETFAAQCGFCTPGMILVARALLDRNPHPTRQEVIESLTGNYCRCTGYEPIIQAILESAERMNGRGS